MKKISIIIPVYNAMTSGGGYINRCVDSVLNQKKFPINDVEIILINDGSKDESLEVLQEIANNNSDTVRLINQKNMGVARTRNKGMKLATGEYTTFLDQDDWIDDDFFATLYDAAHKTNADVVASGYRRPNEKGKIVKKYNVTDSVYGRYMVGTAWAKLHKTEFLRKNSLEFYVTGYGEDLPFSMRENGIADKYVMVPYIGYNWYVNESSVSNTSQKQLTEKTTNDIRELLETMCLIEEPAFGKRAYLYFLFRQMVYCLLFSGRVATRQDFLLAEKQFFAVLQQKDDIFLTKNIHRLLIAPKGESFVVASAVVTFIIFKKLRLMSLFAILWCKPPKSSAK